MNEESIFAAALQKSPAERKAFLDDSCRGNAELRSAVEGLLAASNAAGSFFEHPPAGLDATIDAAAHDTHKPAGWDGSLAFLKPCNKPGRIGKLVGNAGEYEIIEVVGSGGMGVVLRAFDTKLSRVVAVKVLAPELARNPTAVKRFLREAKAAAAVVHDHVVTIHNVEETHQPPFLVMQFVDGQTLQQKIERCGALELKEILRIGCQAAAGLAAAHKHGLVHRDVKPANILLENGIERVKITDFGLARAADDVEITQTGLIAGTPQYMSPEQAKGESVDARSDLFSLGSVLYTMCTGRPAFRAETTMGVLRRVCEDEPRPIHEVNAEIPPWLEGIASKLLAKKPEDRFQTAAEVSELLGQCLAHVQNPGSVPLPAISAGCISQAPAKQSKPQAGGRAEPRMFIAAAVIYGILALGLLAPTTIIAVMFLTRIFHRAVPLTPVPPSPVPPSPVPPQQIISASDSIVGFQPLELRAWANENVSRRYPELALGRLTCGAVPFDIGPKLIHLSGSGADAEYPQRIDGVIVGRSIARLHVLHATQAGAARDTPVAIYKIRYEDGTAADWTILHGRDVDGYLVTEQTRTDNPAARKAAYTGQRYLSGDRVRPVRLYYGVWENPSPEKRVATIDFLSLGTKAAPFCVAMTVESPANAPLAAASPTAAQDRSPGMTRIKRFDPARDKPTAPPWADQAATVQVEDGAWRIENNTSSGNFHVLMATLLDDLPTDGIIVCRAKIKLKTTTKTSWGGIRLGDWEPDHYGYQWPGALYEYRGDVPQWTEKEIRYPAEAFQQIKPPQIAVYFGLHNNGVLWVKDVELLHIPASRAPSAGASGNDFPPRTAAAAGQPAVTSRSSLVFNGAGASGGDASVFAIAYSPDGEMVATGHYDGPVSVWKLATGEPLKTLAVQKRTVSAMAFAGRGKHLATADEGGLICLWNTETWEQAGMLSGHAGRIHTLAFRQDDAKLVSVSLDFSPEGDNSIRVWDVATRSESSRLNETSDHHSHAAISPDGSLVAVANANGRVRLWDLSRQSPAHDFAGFPTSPSSVAFSRDGSRVAAGYLAREPGGGEWNDPENAVVRMWDVKTGELLQEFHGHAGPVIGLEFSPDDRRLLSLASDRFDAEGKLVVSSDRSLRIWNVETGQEEARIEPSSRVNVARWTPKGDAVCSGVRLWNVAALLAAEPAADSAPSEPTAAMWGPVRDGWQVGIGWKNGKLRFAAGEKVEFELKVRNATDTEKTIRVVEPSDWDLWYSGGNELAMRIFGRDEQDVKLAPREEKVIDVPKPLINLAGLAGGAYRVRVTTDVGDKKQQPADASFGFEYDGPNEPPFAVAGDAPLVHPDPKHADVAWGKPVLGLSLGIRVARDSVAENPGGEQPASSEPPLEFFLWNTGSSPADVEYLEHHALDWQLFLRDKAGTEFQSEPILTGPKVEARKRLAAGNVLPLGATGLKRLWLADRQPVGNVAEAYQAWTTFNCLRLDYGHLNLQLTSGTTAVEIKP